LSKSFQKVLKSYQKLSKVVKSCQKVSKNSETGRRRRKRRRRRRCVVPRPGTTLSQLVKIAKEDIYRWTEIGIYSVYIFVSPRNLFFSRPFDPQAELCVYVIIMDILRSNIFCSHLEDQLSDIFKLIGSMQMIFD
jgi:hypothetical protein